MEDIWSVLEVIGILALVFYLAWFVTRFVAARSKVRAGGRFLQVVDRLNISNDKAVLLVRIGAEYCALGVTNHEVRLIKTLDGETAEALGAFAAGQGEAAAPGKPGGFWRNMRAAWAGMGFVRKAAPPQKAEQEQAAEQAEEQSVIDLMNERIKLRTQGRRRP